MGGLPAFSSLLPGFFLIIFQGVTGYFLGNGMFLWRFSRCLA
jgi:hypothetical protein